MCNVITLPEGSPADILKGKKIVSVITGNPLGLLMDNGKVLMMGIERGPALDLNGKPTSWMVLSLDEKVLFRRII